MRRMHDILGWLTDQQWLAILRIGVGLWWLESVRHKDVRGFLRGESMGWDESLAVDHPIPPFAGLVSNTALRAPRSRLITSWLVLFGELSVGVSLSLGLLLPLGA